LNLKFDRVMEKMTVEELGEKLREMYECEGRGKALGVHLFGIKYAEQFKVYKISKQDVLKKAGISEKWHVEINKGANLAGYVSLKEGV
jgi:hypothetical protein